MAEIDALTLLADARDVLSYLKPLPKAQEPTLKHWPTEPLFKSFVDCVERLAARIRPISNKRPEAERAESATLIGVREDRQSDFVEWANALELTLRDILLDRYGMRFYFAHDTTQGRIIVIQHRDLKPFSHPQAGKPEHPSKTRLTPSDIDAMGRYVDELESLVAVKPNSEPDVAIQVHANATPGHKRKRKYTKSAQTRIHDHWEAVKNSGNEELIGFYLTGAETKVAKKFGVARNTLRKSEFFANRDTEAMDWRRRNRKPPGHISEL